MVKYIFKKTDVKYQFLIWKHLLPTPPPLLALSPLPFERTPLINLDLFIYLQDLYRARTIQWGGSNNRATLQWALARFFQPFS